MFIRRLEKRYAKLRRELDKLMAKMASLTPGEERRWTRLEMELCEVERQLLKDLLVVN